MKQILFFALILGVFILMATTILTDSVPDTSPFPKLAVELH